MFRFHRWLRANPLPFLLMAVMAFNSAASAWTFHNYSGYATDINTGACVLQGPGDPSWKDARNWAHTPDDACALNGPIGSYPIDGADVTIAADQSAALAENITLNSLTLENGSLLGAVSANLGVTVTNSFNWQGGAISNNQFTIAFAPSLTLGPNCQAFAIGSSGQFLRAVSGITNQGKFTWNGPGYLYADITNIGTIVLPRNGTFQDAGVGGIVINYGLIQKTLGSGTVNLGLLKNMNTGVLKTDTGIMAIKGGNISELNAGTVISGAGTFECDAAQMFLNGNITVNGTLQLGDAADNVIPNVQCNAAKLIVTDPFGARTVNWLNSDFYSGALTFDAGLTVNMSGSGSKFFHDNQVWTNKGTMNWNGGAPLKTLVDPLINDGGNYNINAAGDAIEGQFTNKGIFNTFAGTTSMTSVLINQGTLNVGGVGKAGTLNINTGTSNLFNTGGAINMEIGGTTGGTQFDRIVALSNFPSTLQMGGTLNASYINGFAPTANQNFKIVQAQSGASVAAGFDVVNSPKTNIVLNQVYTPSTDITLNASPLLFMDPVSLVEGNAGTTIMEIIVKLPATSSKTVTVDYAVSDDITGTTATVGNDYGTAFDSDSVSPGKLVIPAGQDNGKIFVPIFGDTNYEADETFRVTLSNPTNATLNNLQPTLQAKGTITNDDKTKLSINSPSILEGNLGDANKTLNFTVTLSDTVPQDVTVKYATADTNAAMGKAEAGKDYVATSGTLTIPANQTKGIIIVPIKGDNLDEDDETFFVNLSVPTVAEITVAKGVGTIIDNDALPIISTGDVTVSEGTGGVKFANFKVNLVDAVGASLVSGRPVTVTWNTTDGTAKAPGDYTATRQNLVILVGQSSSQFSVPISTDSTDEFDENLFVFLTTPVNGKISTSRVQATITDDDAPPTVSIDSPITKEGNGGQLSATFHVTLSAASGKVVKVALTTANSPAGTGVFPAAANVDYVPVTSAAPVVVSISAGTTVGIAHVTINGDTLDEENETFVAKISSPENATITAGSNTGTGTILDDDTSPSLIIDDVSKQEGGSGFTNFIFTVTLVGASEKAISVLYATADGTAKSTSDYTLKGGSLNFGGPNHITSQKITVEVKGDVLAEPNETFFVLLSGVVNASVSKARGIGTITNDDGSG